MHYARIFSDDSGASVFDEATLTSLAEWPARMVRLQLVPPGLTSRLHPEAEPTLATVLSGWIEITNSGGQTRRLAAGGAMLFTDTTG